MIRLVVMKQRSGTSFAILLMLAACLVQCAITPTSGQSRATSGKTSARRFQQMQMLDYTGESTTSSSPSSAAAVVASTLAPSDGRQSDAGSTQAANMGMQQAVELASTTMANNLSMLDQQQQQQSVSSGGRSQADTSSAVSRNNTDLSEGVQMNSQQEPQSATSTMRATGELSTIRPGGSQAELSQNAFTTSSNPALVSEVTTPKVMFAQQSMAGTTAQVSGNNKQEQVSSTGLPMSTPSSLSMSLDGMIVNSRPRATASDNSAGNQQSRQQNGGRKTKQSSAQLVSTSRIGELPPSGGVESSMQTRQTSRRVPFSGVQFSSPATKGLRTKPRASNQVGSSLGSPVNQMGAGQLMSFDQQTAPNAGLEFAPQGMQMSNQFFRQPQPSVGFRESMMQQQMAMNDIHGGFDGDQQVRLDVNQLQGNEPQNPMDLAGLELMRNLLASGNVAAPSSNQPQRPDDMVMSVMSSADGKERRLVMIARDTLNSLQQFAAQNSQQQQPANVASRLQQQVAGTKISRQQSRVVNNNRPMMSKPADLNVVTETPAANWMVTGQDMWNSNFDQQQQQQQAMMPTTMSTPELRVTTSRQQDEVTSRTTTTTMAPANSMGLSDGAQTTTTTTPSPVSAATTTTQAPSQDSIGSTTVSTTPADSFREVAVSTSSMGGQTSGANLAGEQRQQQAATEPATNGRGGKQQVTKGTKSKSGTQGAKQQSSASSQRGSNGKGKKNASSGSNSKQTSAKQQKSKSSSVTSGKQLGGEKKSSASGVKKQSGNNGNQKQSKATTNGQQLPVARANGTQLGTFNANVDTQSASTTSPVQFSQQAGNSGAGLNEPVQLTNSGRDQLSTTTISTTTATSSRRPSLQQVVSTVAPTDGFGRERQPGSRLEISGASLVAADEQIDKRLEEMERNGQLIPSLDMTAGRQPMLSQGSGSGASGSGSSSMDQLDGLRAAIPGEPQLDYPIYSAPPKTSFDCMSQSCPGGYYADMETQCQVFHICQNDGRFDTFLCPNGTIFSQQHFVCVWWWQVDCQQSQQYYKLNDGIYCNSMFPVSSSSSADSSTGSSLSSGFATAGAASPNSGSLTPEGSQGSTTSGGSSSNSMTDGDLSSTLASARESNNSNQQQQQQQATADSAADAELSQQQQQQLELLARRA